MLSQKDRTAAARPTPNGNHSYYYQPLENLTIRLVSTEYLSSTFEHRSQFPHTQPADRSVLTEGALQ